MNKRKLTRESLTELAKRMPVLSEEVQKSFIGGGNGTAEDPYTWEEYYNMTGSMWTGGYVGNSYTYIYSQSEYEALSESGLWSGGIVGGMGYVLQGVVCLGGGTDVTADDLADRLTEIGTTIADGIVTGISGTISGLLNPLAGAGVTAAGVAKEVLQKKQIRAILDYMRESKIDSVYEIKHEDMMYVSPGATMGNSYSIFYNKKTGEIIGTVNW